MHVLPHPGYIVQKPKEFFKKISPFVSLSISLIRASLSLASSPTNPPAVLGLFSSMNTSTAFSFLQAMDKDRTFQSTIEFCCKLVEGMREILADKRNISELKPSKALGVALRYLYGKSVIGNRSEVNQLQSIFSN